MSSYVYLRRSVILINGIGDYETTLQYTQPSVPTKTDATLNLLLPVLAKPIVQKIVSRSVLR